MDIQKQALMKNAVSIETVEAIFENAALAEDWLADRIRSLCVSHERLRLELQGAEALLRENAQAIEACKRYFEHCERVSVSASHAGCDSGEMAVRMALRGEAKHAVNKAAVFGG